MGKMGIALRWALTLCLLIGVFTYQMTRQTVSPESGALAQAEPEASAQAEPEDDEPADTTAQPQPEAAETTASPAGAYIDGVYRGQGNGHGGVIEVEVTVENGWISAITVLSAEDEDSAYFRDAKKIINKVIDAQHTNLDAISGATNSTWGILDAVDDALKEAKNE